jgi:hypothetical protein
MPDLTVNGDFEDITVRLPENLALEPFDYLGHISVWTDEEDGRTAIHVDCTKHKGTRRVAVQLFGSELWQQVSSIVKGTPWTVVHITASQEVYSRLIGNLRGDADLSYEDDGEDFFPPSNT